jgi:IstB-like ATP binding protein
MIHEILPVGMLACNCSIFGDETTREAERRDFVAHWHEQIGDPTAADGILDRLVHNAHRIDMRGESIRKKRSTKPTD